MPQFIEPIGSIDDWMKQSNKILLIIQEHELKISKFMHFQYESENFVLRVTSKVALTRLIQN